MTTPGYLAVAGVEVANNQRVAAYLEQGLDTPQFEITRRDGCEALTEMAFVQGSCEGATYAWDGRDGSNPIGDWRAPWDGAALVPLTGSLGSAPYNATLLDNFDVAGQPPPGWTGDIRGAGEPTLQALAGVLRSGSGGAPGSAYLNQTFTQDMEAQVRLAPGWAGDSFELWVHVANAGVLGTASGYLAFYDAPSQTIAMQRYGPGSGTGWVTIGSPVNYPLFAGNRILVRTVGGTATGGAGRVYLSCWVQRGDGLPWVRVLAFSLTGAAAQFPTGDRVGLISYTINGQYDELRGGTINGANLLTMNEAGQVGPSVGAGGQGIQGSASSRWGALFPDPGEVAVTMVAEYGAVILRPSGTQNLALGRWINVGQGEQQAYSGIGIQLGGATATIVGLRRAPGGVFSSTTLASGAFPLSASPYDVRESWWLQYVFTSTGVTLNLYGGDPGFDSSELGAHQLAPLIGSWTMAYDATPNASYPGGSEAAAFATATEVGMIGSGTGVTASFPTVETAPLLSLRILPTQAPHYSNPCGLTYPSPAQMPNPLFYPSTYGAFVNPDNDEAPWIDLDQLEQSSGFFGMLLTDIQGLDTTENRSLDASASGIGGILGPIQLQPRVMDFTGYLIASGAPAMMYARRWLAQTLGGPLCPGCAGNYIDVLPTCGAAELVQLEGGVPILPADARRLYDVGLTSFELDTSDSASCDYVLPVKFTLSAADPFLYTLPENETTATLNPAGADDPAIPFESWLFAQDPPSSVCIDLEAPTVGFDGAIITISPQSGRAITGALVFRSQGLYPYAGLFPGECVYPADGTPLWDISTCPFVFDIATLAAGESFTIDSSRRRLIRTLASGQEVNGAPSLALQPGQVVQWIDTCGGEPLQACAQAFSNCTCDGIATVTMSTQHRER